jgi:hypothetical protein
MNTPESEILESNDQYYVKAKSLTDRRTHVLMRGDLFAVLDYNGNIAFGEQGLFFQEARHLSKFAISIQGQRLLPLSAEVRQDNATLGVDLTNPDTRSVDTELAGGFLSYGEQVSVASSGAFVGSGHKHQASEWA